MHLNDLDGPKPATGQQAIITKGDFASSPGMADGADSPQELQRTLRIAIVLNPELPDIDEILKSADYESYQIPLIRGIQDALRDSPTEIVVAKATPSQYLDYFRSNPVDGMIILAVRLEDIPSIRQLSSQRIPYVAIGVSPRSPEDLSLAVVDTANRSGGMKAAQHLISLGHRNIACANLATSLSNPMDRMHGFVTALSVAQRPVTPENQILRAGYHMAEFEPAIEEWLEEAMHKNRVPTAIFGCDFNMAHAAMNVLQKHSFRIPEQISVIGFDDPPQAAKLTPALTTVRQPVYEMGATAAQRLVDALRTPGGKSLSGSVVLDTEIIIRSSTSRVEFAVSAAYKFLQPWRKSA